MVFSSIVRFGWSIGRGLVTYRVTCRVTYYLWKDPVCQHKTSKQIHLSTAFPRGWTVCPLNIVIGFIDKVKNIETSYKGGKEVDQMKNIKEKWVTTRGLITILKGREERGGGSTEETKKREKLGWGRKDPLAEWVHGKMTLPGRRVWPRPWRKRTRALQSLSAETQNSTLKTFHLKRGYRQSIQTQCISLNAYKIVKLFFKSWLLFYSLTLFSILLQNNCDTV